MGVGWLVGYLKINHELYNNQREHLSGSKGSELQRSFRLITFTNRAFPIACNYSLPNLII